MEAGALTRSQHQSARVIKSKEKEVMDSWISLKTRSDSRKTKLLDSHHLQRFLSNYR